MSRFTLTSRKSFFALAKDLHNICIPQTSPRPWDVFGGIRLESVVRSQRPYCDFASSTSERQGAVATPLGGCKDAFAKAGL